MGSWEEWKNNVIVPGADLFGNGVVGIGCKASVVDDDVIVDGRDSFTNDEILIRCTDGQKRHERD